MLAAVGAIALCPVATCSGIATLKYRSDASEDAPPRTPQDLVKSPAGWHDPVTVAATPEPSRAVQVRGSSGDRGLLVPIAESNRFALLVPTGEHLAEGTTMLAPGAAVPAGPGAFVVHHDDEVLIGPSFFGVTTSEIEVYVLEDPRVGARHEARVSGIVAAVGALVSLLTLTPAILLVRRSRRRVGGHDAPA